MKNFFIFDELVFYAEEYFYRAIYPLVYISKSRVVKIPEKDAINSWNFL